ncbi:MAG: hypothetical protein AAFR14_07220, partial [Bacteroidota bacterium]
MIRILPQTSNIDQVGSYLHVRPGLMNDSFSLALALLLLSWSPLLSQISPAPSDFQCGSILFEESFENGIPTEWDTLRLDRAKNSLFNEGWVIDRDTTFTTMTGPSGAQDGSFY